MTRARSSLAGRHVGLVLGTSTGGIGRHVHLLVDGLVARDVRVTVCAPASTDATFGYAAAGAAVVPVEIGKGWRFADVGMARQLRALLPTFDVVHAHGLRPGFAAATARRRASPPLVVTWHNAVLGSPARRRVLARVERLTAQRADVVIGASQDLVDRAVALGARDARMCCLPAPAPPAAIRPREEVRAELGVTDEPLVLAVGRLVPQKRLDVLVEAAARLAADGVRATVAIAGDGRLRPALERQVAARRAPVRLLGHRDDVADLLAAADVVATPSAWEARAFIVQEAMRSGCPVVVTAVGGLPALVGDAGLVVPPQDPAALAGALAEVLADPARAAALGAAGQRLAATWPSEQEVVDTTAGIYRELLDRR
ncbi:MAG TPA: glycosyltransferase family 4 protein [Spirillospora sp.]|nr:glycosyltransferase family 4 protein [Spirillospora sp.]